MQKFLSIYFFLGGERKNPPPPSHYQLFRIREENVTGSIDAFYVFYMSVLVTYMLLPYLKIYTLRGKWIQTYERALFNEASPLYNVRFARLWCPEREKMRWEKNVGIPVKFHAPYLQGPDNSLGLIGGDFVSHSRARNSWWEVQNFCDVGPQGEGPIGKKHTDAATK